MRTTSLLLIGLVYAGCSETSSSTPRDAAPRDVAAPRDLATPSDVTAPSDTAKPRDIATPREVATPSDANAESTVGCWDNPWSEGQLPPVVENIGQVPTYPDPVSQGELQVSVQVDLASLGQEWMGCGITAHYYNQFSYALQGGEDGQTNPLLDLLFSPEGLDCHFLVLRAMNEKHADPWPPLAFTGGNLDSMGNFKLDDPPAVSMVKYLRRYGVETILRPEVAPEDWLALGPDKAPGGDPIVRLAPLHYRDYADYLVAYARAMGEAQGRPIWGIIPQNEPDYVASWLYMYFKPDEMLAFVRDHLRPALQAASLDSTRILGPDTGKTTALPTVKTDNYFTPELNQAFDVLDIHTYDIPYRSPDDSQGLGRLAVGVGRLPPSKPILIEYGNANSQPDDDALGGTPQEMIITAKHLYNQLTLGRASIPLVWQGFWNKPPAGLIHLKDNDCGGWEGFAVPLDYQVLPKYFAYKHFSHNATASSRLVYGQSEDTDTLLLGFLGPGEAQLTLVAVNTGKELRHVSIEFSNPIASLSSGAFQHFRSTYLDRFAKQPDLVADQGRLQLDLPPSSIHTLVLIQ
jgi:hypothetical protein